jgi:hypothetical protein
VSWWALDGKLARAASWALIAIACAPTLYLQFLPMTDLPQYLALSRILTHLHDPRFGFDAYYETALTKAPACLALYAWGWLARVLPLEAAKRCVCCAAVLAYPLGLAALLRALDKPIALALLGLPVVYACSFFLGLVPSSLSAGLAWLAIALLCSDDGSRARRAWLASVCALLPLTHPFGVIVTLAYVLCAALVRRRSERQLPWPWLTPLFAGGLFWGVRALHADGVAAFGYPSLMLRLLRVPQLVIGGFVAPGEGWLLAAELVLFIWFCRGVRVRELAARERALWLLATLCVLGYLALPASTWTSVAIHVRAGELAFALLPALIPAAHASRRRERALPLLLGLGLASAWFTSRQLIAFDAEAKPYAALLARVPERPLTIGLIYDHSGKVASGSPYLHFAAYAQAEQGGFLSLSLADVAWTVPLRRRPRAPVPAPIFGSEWDPALVQVQPFVFRRYDTVIVNGKERREMTIMMEADVPYRLLAQSGSWQLYRREAR